MDPIVVLVIFAAVILVIAKIGDWIDLKTGFVLGSILTGVLLIRYFHTAKDVANQDQPRPGCQYVGNC